MIVWIAHAKVGHRQEPHKVKRPGPKARAFCFVGTQWQQDPLEHSDNVPYNIRRGSTGRHIAARANLAPSAKLSSSGKSQSRSSQIHNKAQALCPGFLVSAALVDHRRLS